MNINLEYYSSVRDSMSMRANVGADPVDLLVQDKAGS